MTTREAVIKKIREAISELKKTLLMIFAEAGESGQAAPKIHACPDVETAKNERDMFIFEPGRPVYSHMLSKISPRFVAVPMDLAMNIISLVRILQKNVETSTPPITQLSYEGEAIPITAMRPYMKLSIAIKDLETLTSCNIEKVHGSILSDPLAKPEERTIKRSNNEQITNDSLTIPKELALSIINDAKKLHDEVSKHIGTLSFLKQLLISIKDLETIASRDIEIGTKCKFRVAIKFLDERKAEWRNTAPPDKITGRISLGFNVEEGKPVRLSISLESARLLVETLTPYLHLTQSRISAGIPRSKDHMSSEAPQIKNTDKPHMTSKWDNIDELHVMTPEQIASIKYDEAKEPSPQDLVSEDGSLVYIMDDFVLDSSEDRNDRDS